MKVLVTGASGLIGRHTVDALLAGGIDVRTLDRGPGGRRPGVEHVRADVVEAPDSLCSAARGCEAVVHLAGKGDVGESRREPVEYARLNSLGTLHALDAAREAGAHFVLASTQRVYALQPGPCSETDAPRPDSPYGYAKWTAELWCRMYAEQYAIPTSVLRFFSVYGPGQQPHGQSGVVTIFTRQALAGEPLVVRSGGRRDFTDARDVARGILCGLLRPPSEPYRVCNVATGVGTSFDELARTVLDVTGSSSRIDEDLSEPAGQDLVADVARAREELGFEARVSLREGLERYVGWLRSSA